MKAVETELEPTPVRPLEAVLWVLLVLVILAMWGGVGAWVLHRVLHWL